MLFHLTNQNVETLYLLNPCTQSVIPFFNKLKNEVQNSILRFCFYSNKEDRIQAADYHFHV